MRTFDVSLSTYFLVITIIVSLITVVALYYLSSIVFKTPFGLRSTLLIALGLFLFLGFTYTAAIQPRYLEVSEQSVIIHRIVGKKIIDRSDIVLVRRKMNMKKDIRTFGSGGFFGCLGYFSSQAEGKYFAYVRDLKSMVYIQTRGLNYVVSCDEPDEFIRVLNE